MSPTTDAQSINLDTPLLRLRTQGSSMHPSLLRVRDVIVHDPERSADLTIDELSERAGVSKATVVRFCKGLGYSGFRDFRAALLREAGRRETRSRSAERVGGEDPLAELTQVTRASIEELRRVLDADRFDAAVSRMERAGQIVWYGTGISGALVEMVDHRFSLAGFNSRSFFEPARFLAEAARLTRDDVVVCVSHSGSTKSVVEPMRQVVRQKASTIAVTNFADSPLAAMCDLLLLTTDREYWVGGYRIPFRHSQQLLLDAILYALVRRTQKEGFKKNW